MNITSAQTVAYLKHLALLAGLTVASVVLTTLLGDIKLLDMSHLSPVTQAMINLILPVLVAAGLRLRDEVNAELQAQQNAKLLAENANLANQVKALTPAPKAVKAKAVKTAKPSAPKKAPARKR